MPFALRFAFIALFFGLTLAACGRTVQEEAPESVTAAAEDEDAITDDEDFEVEGEFTYLRDLILEVRRSPNQATLESVVAQARADGYSDHEIASAMGVAYLITPGRRVMISVVFVRFKAGSAVPADELDAAYEYALTPPRLRETMNVDETEGEPEEGVLFEQAPEEEAATEDASDEDDATDEEEEPRQTGWRRWIPGL